MIAKIVLAAWMFGCTATALMFAVVAGRYLGEAEAQRKQPARLLALRSAAMCIALALLFSLIARLIGRAL